VTHKLFGLFAGVGGIETGFAQAGFEPVLANELDKKAALTYRANYGHELINDDINALVSPELPDFDVLTGGFPCQPFSISGLRQGFQDAKGRGNVFFKIMEIVHAKQPSVIMLENVKHLVTHDEGRTFKIILDALEEAGYHVQHQVLNSKTHGNIPQNRERIFIVGFKNKEHANRFTFPEAIPLTVSLEDLIDFTGKVEDKYYYTSEKHKFYDILARDMNRKGAIYQFRRSYVRENKSGVSPTLTANMGTGGNNVPMVLTDHGIRKLTPRECFNLMGFPVDFVMPEGMAASNLYKQSGNAVVVPVIRRIAENINTAISLDA